MTSVMWDTPEDPSIIMWGTIDDRYTVEVVESADGYLVSIIDSQRGNFCIDETYLDSLEQEEMAGVENLILSLIDAYEFDDENELFADEEDNWLDSGFTYED